jgi:hypothetical protein
MSRRFANMLAMSTGLNCNIVQASQTEWFYVLEERGAPKNAWDWRDFAHAYGPFASQDAAVEHLGNNHGNPGGWWVQPLAGDGTDKPLDEVYTKLFEAARESAKTERSRSTWRPRMYY